MVRCLQLCHETIPFGLARIVRRDKVQPIYELFRLSPLSNTLHLNLMVRKVNLALSLKFFQIVTLISWRGRFCDNVEREIMDSVLELSPL